MMKRKIGVLATVKRQEAVGMLFSRIYSKLGSLGSGGAATTNGS